MENVVVKDEVKEVVSIDKVALSQLIDRAKAIEANCRDFTIQKANLGNIRFTNLAGLTFLPDEDGVVRTLDLSKHSLNQLCAKIGVPIRYAEKCIKTGRVELAQDNINSWLEDYNKSLFIREYSGRARGILSSRYSVCDTSVILEALDSALRTRNYGGYKIKGSFLTEERLHLRLIGEQLPIDNDDLFLGIFVDSSDVGRSTLTVRIGIYKQVCTNGLVVAQKEFTLFEQKHVGISSDEFHSGLVASLSDLDSKVETLINCTREAKKATCNPRAKDPNSFEGYVDYVKELTHFDDEGVKKIVTLQSSNYDYSKWGLINSITEVAQDFTLEKRIELEKLAGKLLVA